MPVDFDEFVANLMSSGNYWLFSVEGHEWHYVLEKIGKEFFDGKAVDTNDFGTIFPNDGGTPVCWARRDRVPVEVVASRFGLPVAAVRKSKMIRLAPLPEPPVMPNVGYYGEA